VGSDKFILPATSVQMALRPTEEAISTIQGTGEVMELRGRILPLHRLHRRFNIPADSDKPWEGIDYFARGDAHVDIKDILGGWGKATPSLHELATLSGIPGKLDVDGNAVAGLWLDGHLDRIVAYNECDALTTYLVWLRLAHLGGHFDDRGYAEEQQRVRALVEGLIAQGRAHLATYLTAWDQLSGRS